ncbi:MAG TPA: nucleoside triphosphate pyrophosphatase [Alphaproteobacteria bacterium]
MSARLILGSSSPRRLDILNQIGMPPDVVVGADIDETPLKGELPHLYCKRIAQGKNDALASQYPDDYLVTADTTVVVGRRILGNPADEAEALRMMRLLSGRNHRVYTAVVVRAPDGRVSLRLVESRVKVKNIADADLAAALAIGEWKGRAGGYSYIGYFSRFIQKMTGSSSAILGLPAYETVNLLTGLGYKGK